MNTRSAGGPGLIAPPPEFIVIGIRGADDSAVTLRPRVRGCTMTQTTNKLFDDFAKLMTDAAGAAQSARQDFETLACARMERVIRGLDLV
jgi:hypothetical protein